MVIVPKTRTKDIYANTIVNFEQLDISENVRNELSKNILKDGLYLSTCELLNKVNDIFPSICFKGIKSEKDPNWLYSTIASFLFVRLNRSPHEKWIVILKRESEIEKLKTELIGVLYPFRIETYPILFEEYSNQHSVFITNSIEAIYYQNYFGTIHVDVEEKNLPSIATNIRFEEDLNLINFSFRDLFELKKRQLDLTVHNYFMIHHANVPEFIKEIISDHILDHEKVVLFSKLHNESNFNYDHYFIDESDKDWEMKIKRFYDEKKKCILVLNSENHLHLLKDNSILIDFNHFCYKHENRTIRRISLISYVKNVYKVNYSSVPGFSVLNCHKGFVSCKIICHHESYIPIVKKVIHKRYKVTFYNYQRPLDFFVNLPESWQETKFYEELSPFASIEEIRSIHSSEINPKIIKQDYKGHFINDRAHVGFSFDRRDIRGRHLHDPEYGLNVSEMAAPGLKRIYK
ncbi:hypothetical protein O9G_004571 [Rozella allomycis CSF55]|uniref:Uncharacterized protein n=1 Tax=Rozella allomycis (strain CSF55) TaxID=988480 RepID=A0A075AXD3_ROZAC|nr:hypothetical protein O9G_004571 [Rozella allomycis CSF55]|eukprot:EPZ34975.1 hypothetical protein O9G_004571 [Rozella allomycis CSF55]